MEDDGFWWWAAHCQRLDDIVAEIKQKNSLLINDLEQEELSKEDIEYINRKLRLTS